MRSNHIVKGKIIKVNPEGVAIYEVTGIIKDKGDVQLGSDGTVHLYEAENEIGREFIICDAKGQGVLFPVVSVDLEEEIRFLSDTTRQIANIDEAIMLAGGISRYSNYTAREYIEKNYDACFDALTNQIRSLRRKIDQDPNYSFADYRITQLTYALAQKRGKRTQEFLLSEIDSVMASDTANIDMNKIPYLGGAPLGSYLKAMLMDSKKYEYRDREISAKLTQTIQESTSKHIMYCAYALAFTDTKFRKFKKLSDEQRNYAAYGVACAVSWRSYWRVSNRKSPLVDEALSLCVD
ncbi:MAG: hypothetical protein GY861_13260, partial [bacterium]|nr:hypothetical protein [bacterium]